MGITVEAIVKKSLRRVSLLAASALAVTACALASGRPQGTNQHRSDTQILVNRSEVRITFPPEANTVWGWPAGDLSRRPNYVWHVQVPGTVGPKGILARVFNWHDSAGVSYRSLTELFGSPDLVLGVCMPGMILQCDRKHTTVSARGRRVVITLKDSATIAELFGMLPESVTVQRDWDYQGYRAAVRYAEPFIEPPDSQSRARREAQVRAYEFSIRRVRRTITPGSRELMVGDSMFFYLNEIRCKHDVCSPGQPPNAEWSVDDTTVLRIASGPMWDVLRQQRRPGDPWRIFVTALKPGRAVLSATWDSTIVDSVTVPPRNPVEVVITVSRRDMPARGG